MVDTVLTLCILKKRLDRPTRKVNRLTVVKHKVHEKNNYAHEKKLP